MAQRSKSGTMTAVRGYELELNDIRSEVSRLSTLVPTTPTPVPPPALGADLAAALAQLTAQMQLLAARTPEADTAADPSVAIQRKIMRAIETADGGKPGYVALSDLEIRFNLSKSQAHWHTNELEKQGKIWIRKTHDPKTGRPHHRAYHPAALRA